MSQNGCCGNNMQVSLNQFKKMNVEYKSQIHPHSVVFSESLLSVLPINKFNKNGLLKFNRPKL